MHLVDVGVGSGDGEGVLVNEGKVTAIRSIPFEATRRANAPVGSNVMLLENDKL